MKECPSSALAGLVSQNYAIENGLMHSWKVNLAARFLPHASHGIMHECAQRSL